jgi:hypothetical protein
MRMFSRVGGVTVGVLTLGLCSAVPAHADVIDGGLTLDTDPTVFYQQTDASPCVIGGNNCQNPGTFPSVDSPAGGNGDFTITSFQYTASQVQTIVGGSSFTVGIDYNDTNVAQILYSFEARYLGAGGALISSQVFDVPTALPTVNDGAGWSDFLLTGFTLAPNTAFVQFVASWRQNDGPDRYFLIGANAQPEPSPVPEPATLLLLGSSVGGLLAARRRRQSGR